MVTIKIAKSKILNKSLMNMTFKITTLGFIVLLTSCYLMQMTKGELNDSKRALTKNKNYFREVYFRGIVLGKSTSIRQNRGIYELNLRLLNIDSIPNMVNRSYLSYFLFKNENELTILVNETVFNNVMIGDTIIKAKKSINLVTKTPTTQKSYGWLSQGNEWLSK